MRALFATIAVSLAACILPAIPPRGFAVQQPVQQQQVVESTASDPEPALEPAPPVVVPVYGYAPAAQQECKSAYGTTACGYGCAAGYGVVRCASQPGGTCAAAYGDVTCSN